MEENGRRNHFMSNLQESMDRAGIELATPGSAIRHVPAARHVMDCATWPVNENWYNSRIKGDDLVLFVCLFVCLF